MHKYHTDKLPDRKQVVHTNISTGWESNPQFATPKSIDTLGTATNELRLTD